MNESDELMRKVSDMHDALLGKINANGEHVPGALSTVDKHNEILFGTEKDPGGLVAEVRSLRTFQVRALSLCGFIMVAIGGGWEWVKSLFTGGKH